MSQLYYIQKWDAAQRNLLYVVSSERPLRPEPLPKTLKDAFNKVCTRYVQYIAIYKELAKCYDFMVQPQKRHLLARCIEGVTGRIVELRHELFRIRINEFAHFGPFCVANQVLPSQLEMFLSRTFEAEKLQRIKQRYDLLNFILESMGMSGYHDFEPMAEAPHLQQVMSDKRRRTTLTARMSADSMPSSRRPSTGLPIKRKGTDMTNPVLIQKQNTVNWKLVQAQFQIFQSRNLLDATRIDQERFLNMDLPETNTAEVQEAKEREAILKSYVRAEANEDVYVQHKIVATETLKDSTAAVKAEANLKQNIVAWMMECHDVTGVFPDYPGEDLGGLDSILTGKNPDEVKDDLDFMDEKVKAKPKPKEKPKEKKPSKKPEPLAGFTQLPSSFVDPVLVDAMGEYELYWRNRDEKHNFKQNFCRNLLEEKVQGNLDSVLRQKIDEQMRHELELLALAVDKMKVTQPKPKKPKKERKKKEKKKKKLKDLTPGADLEVLYTELVKNGVAKRVHNVNLMDYKGEMNLTSEEENGGNECLPDVGDVRKMLFDLVVLPMSSPRLHQDAPCCKSLMLAGPRCSGKKMLVHAVCNELGANLMDLSAINIQDKYPDQEGAAMLVHLVMKVGKLLEPTIIFIDNCELMFTKKLPPGINTNPGRLKSNLTKAMKTLGPEDRIMLIGCSRRPYLAAKGPLMKMYERVVLVTPPAYASRFSICQKELKPFIGQCVSASTISTLAKISATFTTGDIIKTIREVLTQRKLTAQGSRPLPATTFSETLSMHTPVFREEMAALLEWYQDTPLSKLRRQVRELEAAGTNIFLMV